EIIALKAAGVSALRLFRPVLAVALTITAVTAGLTLIANPLANREFQRQLFKILQSRAVSSLQERVFNNTFGDVINHVEEEGAPRVEKPEKDLTLGALVTRIAELRADRHARAPYLIELHKRFALPLAAVVFALVAFPLAIRSHRGGRSVALAGSLAILLTYY